MLEEDIRYIKSILDEYYKPLFSQEFDLREIKKHVGKDIVGVGRVTGYAPDIIE